MDKEHKAIMSKLKELEDGHLQIANAFNEYHESMIRILTVLTDDDKMIMGQQIDIMKILTDILDGLGDLPKNISKAMNELVEACDGEYDNENPCPPDSNSHDRMFG